MNLDKIEYGLKAITVFPISEGAKGVLTYGDPVKLPGAQSLTTDAQTNEAKIYADDSVYFATYTESGYTGSIGFVSKTDIIGQTLFGDRKTSGGGLVEVVNATPKRFGVAFQTAGDAKNARHVLYNVTFSRGSSEHKTTEEGVEAATYSVDFTAIPMELADGTMVTKGRFEEGATEYETVMTKLTLPTLATDAAE